MQLQKQTRKQKIFLSLLFITGFIFCLNVAYGSDPTSSTEESFTQHDKIHKEADKMPRYPGGDEKLMQFISANVVYPKAAKQNQIQGKVIINFVVEKDGSISNVKVSKGLGYGCDEEALRVTRLLTKWIPGEIKGNPVRVILSLPFYFKLQ